MATRPTAEELWATETIYGVRDLESEIDHRPVYYPVTDGMPMSDSQLGGAEMVRITETLQDWFAADPNVYVWMNMFVYFEPRVPRSSVSPEVFVVHGVPKEPERVVYFVWREGVPPTVTFEVLSSSTHLRDRGYKRELYERMGVREYILYDPHHEWMTSPLRLPRLLDDVFVEVEPVADGGFFSEHLGLYLRLVDRRLRFFNPQTGEMLRSPAERTHDAEAQSARDAEARRLAEAQAATEAAARRITEEHAIAEARARRAAEDRAAELQARIAALEAQLRHRDDAV